MKKVRVRIRQEPDGSGWWVESWKPSLWMWLSEKYCSSQEEATQWAQKIKDNLEHPQEYEIS